MPAAAAAVATWIAAHAGAVFTMAALAAVSLVSADRMKMSPREDPGRPGQLVNTCDNRIPLPLVYGRTRLGINRVYACVTGEDNKYLHLVGNICEGPVKGIYGSVPRNHIDNGDFAQWSNGPSAAPDGWTLTGHTGGAVAREGTIKKIGAYSAKLTSTTVAGEYKYVYQDVHDSFGIAYWRGRTITVGAWLWCDTASALRICVHDGVWSDGTYHPGDGQWHWVTVTYTIKADASIVRPYALIVSGDGVARVGYVDGMTLVEGSYCPAFDPDDGVPRVPQIFLGDKLYTEYGDKFYYEFFRGTSDQAVCSTLATATAGEAEPWNEPKHYTAYIYCRFEYDPDVFQGLPDITMVVEGMEVYNPTTGVTEYTRNPALHALDYMTRSSKRGGMQIGSSRIDTALIETAAAYCDTKGWTCDICLRDESSAIDHFQGILNTFRGDLIYSDSIFQLKYRDLNYESPVMDITENDVVEQGASTLRIEQPSIFNTPNAVRCRYINEEKEYTFDDFILSDSVAIAADGDYREQVAEFPGMLNPSNVAKMAAYLLERARLNKTASLVIGSRGMALEPHDLITLTHSWPGWDEKIMRVSGASISYDGNVALSLEEEYASFYDDDYEITPEMFYDTTLPDPRAAIPSVINVSHAEETYYYRGRTFTRWRINFDRPTLESYPFWDYAEVWVKIGKEGEWAFATKSQGDYVLDPVEEGETYYVNIVGVSIFGGKQAFGEGYQASTTIQGMSGLPSDVAWMTAVAHGDSVSIYAPELNEPDVFGYEVRMGAAFDGGVVVGFNETPNFRLSGVAPGTKTFWMKAKNNAGFYSENAVSAQVVVFYPSGYTVKNTWSWDYSTGTHDNTEQYTYSAVDSLRCAHTGGVLEGTWTSPEYNLGSVKDVRIWGDFITGLQSTDGLWGSVFSAGDLWGDRISAGQKWYQVFAPSTTGHLKATLHYGDTTGNLTNSIDRFEMFSPEVSARYVQVEITITDPALDVYTYVNELNMTAAFWRDTP